MYNELFLSVSLLSALIAYAVDYGLGRPGDEKPNYKALLFGWSLLLSKKVLKKANVWDKLQAQLTDQLDTAASPLDRKLISYSFRQIVFDTARPHFTWQNIVGMCPICTHFWINFLFYVLVILFYQIKNIIIFGLYFFLSHLFIRLFKKI